MIEYETDSLEKTGGCKLTFFKKEIYNRNSLSTKIILMVEVILLISSILFCSVSVYRARVAIRKAIQQRMLDIANCDLQRRK